MDVEDDAESIPLVHDANFKTSESRIKKEKEEEECIALNESDDDKDMDDKDPMDLLELLQRRSSDEHSDAKSNTDNENDSDSAVSLEQGKQVSRLMDRCIWAFPDFENKSTWCVWCNTNLKWFCQTVLAKHEKSSSHEERSLHFRRFLDKLDKDTDRSSLYSNKSFNGDMKGVKKQRETLENDFLNFLWDKWEEEHEWLVRTNERFIAYCKYCHMKIGVGVTYVRKQHEESNKHKECKAKAPKRRATICGDLQSFQSDKLESVAERNDTREKESNVEETKNMWFEKSKTTSDLCRCKLCDITMFQKSFSRHTSSNLHKQNLNALDNPGISDKLEKPDWVSIQKDHEWLIEDPKTPMEAFCKYCQKRIAHGASSVKRLIHEHSSSHRAAVQNFFKKSDNFGENIDEKYKKLAENDNENNTITEKRDEDSETANWKNHQSPAKKRRRIKKTVKKKYPWAKSYKKDPKFFSCQYCKVLLTKLNFRGQKHEISDRHKLLEKEYLDKLDAKKIKNEFLKELGKKKEFYYPWLVKFKPNNGYIFCKYCNLRLARTINRSFHQNTKRHQEAKKRFFEKEAKKKNKRPHSEVEETSLESESDSNTKNHVETPQTVKLSINKCKSTMTTQANLRKMKAQIMEWQKRFVWLRFKKNLLFNYGFCSYCKKAIYIPSPGYARKHQKTNFHIRARTEVMQQETARSQTSETGSNEGSSSNTEEHDLKTSSLQTSIATANRLTEAHLQMITFMQNNGRNESDIVLKTKVLDSQGVKSMPPPPPSPSVDSHSSMHISRDPFDLFFNSMSETLKRMPPDLASEGKLKVMQIIFDLEIRALRRQNQTEITNTTSTNDDALNTCLAKQSDTAVQMETPNTQPQQINICKNQEHQNQLQPQNKRLHNIYNIPAKTQHNSLLLQQLSQPHQLPSPRNVVRIRSHGISSQQFKTSSNMESSQVQLDSPQNQRSFIKTFTNNFNQRYNTLNSFTTSNSGQQSSTSSAYNRVSSNQSSYQPVQNNTGNPKSNKISIIRPVPLTSLTVKKFSNTDEQPIHHIQLNSSTQSKIIPLDNKNTHS